MTEEPAVQPEGTWTDDVLDRKRLADFLSAYLTQEAGNLARTKGIGLTISLDADWGYGKSFFVRHWAHDLRGKGHPVVMFDAWENDIGEAASIALMAVIKDELEEWEKRLPNGERLKKRISKSTSEVVRNLRRAVLPATKVVVESLIKKTTGIAVGELLDLSTDRDDHTGVKDLSSATSATIEKGLDRVFKAALDEHKSKSIAIKEFKESLGNLVEAFEQSLSANLPMFVFVDEVDRCRPSYAIKLLEEIKHVFGARNVCFVLSTNQNQLAESIRAIYGAGFDAQRYLKRFFDRRCQLPEPDHKSYAKLLISENPDICGKELFTGLPKEDVSTHALQRSLAVVTEAFGLDLRSEKQVFQVTLSAVSAIERQTIFILWLLFLAALDHKDSTALSDLFNNKRDRQGFHERCRPSLVRDIEFKHLMPREEYGSRQTEHAVLLSEIAWQFYSWSFQSLNELFEQSSGTNRFNYPANNINQLAAEMPHSYSSGQVFKPSIRDYPDLLRYAGLASA
ncbi:P-loop NTPase fold protein [Frateuria sp. GZRe12]|uniref:KAP family P-loop NTPase fold protein n=1 Tax=Frateuria sp. GZRe12 TaxID=3351533 RepID=UPI003EDBFC77